jgi:SOS response regulatory protein OraA/RecX
MTFSSISDTHPDAERVQIKLIRHAPSWRNLELMGQMFHTIKQLALIILRQRFPSAAEEELRRCLATQLFGKELTDIVYGPLQSSEESDSDSLEYVLAKAQHSD